MRFPKLKYIGAELSLVKWDMLLLNLPIVEDLITSLGNASVCSGLEVPLAIEKSLPYTLFGSWTGNLYHTGFVNLRLHICVASS